MGEVYLSAATFVLIFGYHLRLWWKIRSNPHATAFGSHNQTRSRWVEHFAGGANEILVVQTLRNWIMSSTFQASTAILIALGLLGVALTSDKLSNLAQELNTFGSHEPALVMLKLLLLAFDFLTAFFSASLAIRSLIHCGFMINLPLDIAPQDAIARAKAELARAALFHFIALRCYYLSVPLALWLIGPAWMLAGAIVLSILLSRID